MSSTNSNAGLSSSDRPSRKIGVYGGTFDPVHIGHLIVATEMRFRLGLDQVIFMPAGNPPHKLTTEIAPARARLAMLRMATAREPAFVISDYELSRPRPSYTVETLEHLRHASPGDDLTFIVGEDALGDFPRWHEPMRILELARLAVATRPGVEVDRQEIERDLPGSTGRIQMIDVPQVEIASRDLRNRVRNQSPITYQVPGDVEQYIVEQRLYLSEV